MQNFLRFSGAVAAALAFAVSAPSAVAQEKTAVWECQEVGGSPPEPLGDREGHSISVGQYSCRADRARWPAASGPARTCGSGTARKPADL